MKTKLLLSSTLLFCVSVAHSEIYAARNSGMGGVGVASSRFDSAAHANPALLVRPGESKRIAIVMPSIGAEASDQHEVADTLDDMDELFDEFEAAVDVVSPSFDITRADELKDEILADLSSIDEKPVTAEVSTLFSVAIPTKGYSWALDRRYSGVVIAQLDYDPSDEAVIDAAIAAQDEDELDNINSSANATGVVITETVLSVAKGFILGEHSFSVGISPKIYQIETYFYSDNANDINTDNIEAEDYLKEYSDVNLDLGLAYYPTSSLTLGLMLRDLIGHDYVTINVNGEFDTYETQLSATAAIAYQTSFFTAAIDADVVPQKGLKSVEDSQFIRGGIELNAWDWVQLRAGFRSDSNSVREDVVTVGLNLSPLDTLHIGLSGWAGDGDAAGFALALKILI